MTSTQIPIRKHGHPTSFRAYKLGKSQKTYIASFTKLDRIKHQTVARLYQPLYYKFDEKVRKQTDGKLSLRDLHLNERPIVPYSPPGQHELI